MASVRYGGGGSGSRSGYVPPSDGPLLDESADVDFVYEDGSTTGTDYFDESSDFHVHTVSHSSTNGRSGMRNSLSLGNEANRSPFDSTVVSSPSKYTTNTSTRILGASSRGNPPRPVSANRRQRPASASMSSTGRNASSTRIQSRPVSASSARSTSRGRFESPNFISAHHAEVDRLNRKKHVPSHFYQDPEAMYEEIQQLKKKMTELSSDNVRLKTQNLKLEADLARADKQVEELLKSRSVVETGGSVSDRLKENNIVRSLKSHVRQLESSLAEREEELRLIRSGTRHTRVRELETELKAYYTESRRLQGLVEQLQMDLSQAQNQGAPSSVPPGSAEVENLVLRLREKNFELKEVLKSLKNDYDHTNTELEGMKHENAALLEKIQLFEREFRKRETNSTDSDTVRTLQEKISESNARVAELSLELERCRDSFSAERAVLEERIRSAEIDAEEAKQSSSSNNIFVDNLQEEKKKACMQVEEAEARISELRLQISDLTDQIEVTRSDLIEAQTHATLLREEKEAMNSKADALLMRCSSLEAELQSKSEEIQSLKSSKDEIHTTPLQSLRPPITDANSTFDEDDADAVVSEEEN